VIEQQETKPKLPELIERESREESSVISIDESSDNRSEAAAPINTIVPKTAEELEREYEE